MKKKIAPFPEPLDFYVAQKLLQAATKAYPEIWDSIRRKAIARLEEHNPEEIGSSDISCAAIELVQRAYILLPGVYKLTTRESKQPYSVRIKPNGATLLTPLGKRDPKIALTINENRIEELFDVNQGVRATSYFF